MVGDYLNIPVKRMSRRLSSQKTFEDNSTKPGVLFILRSNIEFGYKYEHTTCPTNFYSLIISMSLTTLS